MFEKNNKRDVRKTKKPKKELSYIHPVRSGQWAISKCIEGDWVYLIQGRSLDKQNDYVIVMTALGIPTNNKNINRYFPLKSKKGTRCPTFALMKLFGEFNYTQNKKKEIGV